MTPDEYELLDAPELRVDNDRLRVERDQLRSRVLKLEESIKGLSRGCNCGYDYRCSSCDAILEALACLEEEKV